MTCNNNCSNFISINNSGTRNVQIDFLRGIAILLVLILHFHLACNLSLSFLDKIFPASAIIALARNGNYGVTMFFVISGFLITTTSLERYGELGKIKITDFYIFRCARIMPCLVLMLTLVIIGSLFSLAIFQNRAHSTSLLLTVISILTFWHNILMAKFGYFNYCLNILWSLSVEEVFYLTFPIICVLLKRPRFIVPFWIVLIILAPICRKLAANNEIVALYGYFSCFDGIAIGCCAALLANKTHTTICSATNTRTTNKTSKNECYLLQATQYSAAIAAGIIIVWTYFHGEIMQNIVFGISLIAVNTGILLICATTQLQQVQRVQQIQKAPLNSGIIFFCFSCFSHLRNAIAWMGKNSYELYLFHVVILALMIEIIGESTLKSYDKKLLWLTLFFSVTLIAAAVIGKFYSQPINKMLRKYLRKHIEKIRLMRFKRF